MTSVRSNPALKLTKLEVHSRIIFPRFSISNTTIRIIISFRFASFHTSTQIEAEYLD